MPASFCNDRRGRVISIDVARIVYYVIIISLTTPPNVNVIEEI